MGHSNQSGTFWQVGNLCHTPDIRAIRKIDESDAKFVQFLDYLYGVKATMKRSHTCDELIGANRALGAGSECNEL